MLEFIQLLIAGVSLGCIYGLLALGFVLIYKATEQVNFAQGDIMMMGMYFALTFITGVYVPPEGEGRSWWLVPGCLIAVGLAAFLFFKVFKERVPALEAAAAQRAGQGQFGVTMLRWGTIVAVVVLSLLAAISALQFLGSFRISWWIALPLSAIFGGMLGYALDAVIVRRIIGQPAFAVVIVTLALGFGLRAVAGAVWGSDDQFFSAPYSDLTISFGGGPGQNPVVIPVPEVVIIGGTAVMITVLYLFFRYTKMGVAMLAASQNQLAAYYMGIPVKYVFSMIWAISAATAAIAGVLLVPSIQTFSPEVGLLSIIAFAAAVIGGFGSLPGAIVGGLIIGVAEQFSKAYLPYALTNWISMDSSLAEKIPLVTPFALMLLVLIVRPQGLFAQIQRKKV